MNHPAAQSAAPVPAPGGGDWPSGPDLAGRLAAAVRLGDIADWYAAHLLKLRTQRFQVLESLVALAGRGIDIRTDRYRPDFANPSPHQESNP